MTYLEKFDLIEITLKQAGFRDIVRNDYFHDDYKFMAEVFIFDHDRHKIKWTDYSSLDLWGVNSSFEKLLDVCSKEHRDIFLFNLDLFT